ncbi:archaemetzincin family Zn-dependent metalloprotease [Methanogenium marinum]|uniref:Archaemetzincin family Zn-dependent metalloprotease n=1 Tax=Methanogenium marinum TaxID=348610 RepID=A0A9Q4PY03_9EURY|nr:archaemetzincin family Zn-dependent metalloprotease [Methanogenium marinum]MDE4907798.1 archaemetzincin family Zn-dependent metalloprotease [Methanogenium marinum]
MSFLIFWDSTSPQGLQIPVAQAIGAILGTHVELQENPVMLRGFDGARGQYNASHILTGMQDIYTRKYGIGDYILIIVGKDLYIPGRDFVFGLARPSIRAGIVSTTRLNNQYYQRKSDMYDTIDRVVKEGSHEFCHMLGLDHCRNSECIMFCPSTLDELDRKRKTLCPACQRKLKAAKRYF